MDRSPIRDLIVGLFVLAGLAAIAYLSIWIGGFEWYTAGKLKLSAGFNETGGLDVRAPVVIAGVKVGEVSAITLGKDFRARVTLDLDSSLQLPADTSASILTSGILGDRYIELNPGGDEKILKSGDEITWTQPAMILEKLVGQFITNMTKGNSQSEKAPATRGAKP
jgi:phospholipid/cholesterol/gamma-HCH transport system substrate-binding protein